MDKVVKAEMEKVVAKKCMELWGVPINIGVIMAIFSFPTGIPSSPPKS